MKTIQFKGDIGPGGTLHDPVLRRDFPFEAGTPISVPDEVADRAIESGLWEETTRED